MEVKYAVYRIEQIKNQDGTSYDVLGILVAKFDTEEQAIYFLKTSPQLNFIDCTIIKVYNVKRQEEFIEDLRNGDLLPPPGYVNP